MDTNEYRIESEDEVKAYLAKLKYAIEAGATINFQEVRHVDNNKDEKYTNKYTVATLFPDENPVTALKRELLTLTVSEYMRTVKDRRFPNRSEMREFGKRYNGSEEVYIKVRVELLDPLGFGNHTTFVMSFHFAQIPFEQDMFPYNKGVNV